MGLLKGAAGIDEAGYGPTLGPLVTTCLGAVYSQRFDAEAFSRLITGVSGLEISDSKKLFSPGKGLKRLERVALSLLQTVCQREINSFSDLISAVTGRSPSAVFSESPWYSGKDSKLPVSAKPVGYCSESVLKEAGIDFLRVESQIVSVPDFNGILSGGFNKGELLLSKVGDMLRSFFFEDVESIHITVDRLGGRKYYRQFLLEQFAPVDSLRTQTESEHVSEYQVVTGSKSLTVRFAVKADAENVMTAAASCISKYIRELSMNLFNEFFTSLVPGIKATQGYPQDAKRFLADISNHVSENAMRLLIREK